MRQTFLARRCSRPEDSGSRDCRATADERLGVGQTNHDARRRFRAGESRLDVDGPATARVVCYSSGSRFVVSRCTHAGSSPERARAGPGFRWPSGFDPLNSPFSAPDETRFHGQLRQHSHGVAFVESISIRAFRRLPESAIDNTHTIATEPNRARARGRVRARFGSRRIAIEPNTCSSSSRS